MKSAENKTTIRLEPLRHSLAHLMAAAILERFPHAKIGIGPVIENGFYYDFDFDADQRGTHADLRRKNRRMSAPSQRESAALHPEDLPEIENRMRELITRNLMFKKETLTFPAAKKMFRGQPYKLELISELHAAKKTITVYTTREQGSEDPLFVDLCAGPHIKTTSEIASDAFLLTHIAGAYWKGSEKNPMLTRVYGVAFSAKQKLDDYLILRADAERRDHRKLGERLELFMIDERIGKGLPVWLPKGYLVRRLIEDYLYALEEDRGYQHVLTPHLAKKELYEKSGHLSHYCDDMFSPVKVEDEHYYLRPMNCPHHHMIFSYRPKSYRELPLRIAEFGTVYRYERSGVLTGFIRLRSFTQNDAHIYLTQTQLEPEILDLLAIHQKVFDDFQISREDYWFRLSLPDFKNKEKYGDVKNKAMWERGAHALRGALKKANLPFLEAEGEASFYGPKIDIQIKDARGHEDTIATIQVDYYSAPRFHLSYIDADGKEQPPVIIHRAIIGAFDRFFAFLLEKTGGNLPLWLAPVQVKIISVGEAQAPYAKGIYEHLISAHGIRAELSNENLTVGKRIREAELQKIPYVLVAGAKEMSNHTVNIRHITRGQEGELTVPRFIDQLKKELVQRR